jgi:hypothetical protein
MQVIQFNSKDNLLIITRSPHIYFGIAFYKAVFTLVQPTYVVLLDRYIVKNGLNFWNN